MSVRISFYEIPFLVYLYHKMSEEDRFFYRPFGEGPLGFFVFLLTIYFGSFFSNNYLGIVSYTGKSMTGFLSIMPIRGKYEVSIMVNPNFRRQRVAFELLEEAELYAEWAGIDKLWLKVVDDNNAAVSLYKHHSYNIVGSGNERNYDYLVMEKVI